MFRYSIRRSRLTIVAENLINEPNKFGECFVHLLVNENRKHKVAAVNVGISNSFFNNKQVQVNELKSVSAHFYLGVEKVTPKAN